MRLQKHDSKLRYHVGIKMRVSVTPLSKSIPLRATNQSNLQRHPDLSSPPRWKCSEKVSMYIPVPPFTPRIFYLLESLWKGNCALSVFVCREKKCIQLVLKIIAITMTAFMRGIFALCAQLGEISLYKWNTLGSRRDNVVYEKPKKCQRSNGGVAFSSGLFSGACGCFCVTWNHIKIWYAQRRPCCWNFMLIKYISHWLRIYVRVFGIFAKYFKIIEIIIN